MKKKGLFILLLKNIGNVLISKLDFHSQYTELEGNFASASDIPKDDTLKAKLSEHLSLTMSLTKPILQKSIETDDFLSLVFIQPLVDEISNASVLLKYINSNSNELNEANEILELAKTAHFLDSSVEYPNDFTEKPMQRFNFC